MEKFHSLQLILHRHFFICIVLVVYILFSLWDLTKLGFFYDELLHAVTAQRLLVGDGYLSQGRELVSLHLFGLRLPVMSLHYLGHLKSYLLLPWFYLFGDSLIVLRLFSITCGALTVVLVYTFVRRNFALPIAFISTILFVFDPTFILLSQFDFAPTSLQNILKLLIFIIFFELWKKTTNSKRVWLLFGVLCGFIIWDKLIGVWIVFPVMFLLFYRYRWFVLSSLRSDFSYLLFFSLGFLLAVSPVLYFFIQFPFFREVRGGVAEIAVQQQGQLYFFSFFNYFSSKVPRFWDTLNGVGAVNGFIFEREVTGGIFGIIFFTCLTLLGLRFWKGKVEANDSIKLIIVLFLIIFCFILITPNARWGHHFFFLWPLPHILIAYVFWNIVKQYSILLIVCIALIQSLVLFNIHQSIDSGNVRSLWDSEEKVVLGSYLLKHWSKQSVLAVDWGISLPVGFVTRGKIPISDLEGIFKRGCSLVEEHIFPDTQTIVLYRRNLERILQEYSSCKNPLVLYEYEQVIVGPFIVMNKI